jgi:hypothetical protein
MKSTLWQTKNRGNLTFHLTGLDPCRQCRRGNAQDAQRRVVQPRRVRHAAEAIQTPNGACEVSRCRRRSVNGEHTACRALGPGQQSGRSKMTAKILDGNALAQKLRADFKTRAEALLANRGTRPGLAVILVGEDPASQVYVRNKVNACAQAGFTPRRSPTRRRRTAAGLRPDRRTQRRPEDPRHPGAVAAAEALRQRRGAQGDRPGKGCRRFPRRERRRADAGPPALHPLHALRRHEVPRRRRHRPQGQGSGDPRDARTSSASRWRCC